MSFKFGQLSSVPGQVNFEYECPEDKSISNDFFDPGYKDVTI